MQPQFQLLLISLLFDAASPVWLASLVELASACRPDGGSVELAGLMVPWWLVRRVAVFLVRLVASCLMRPARCRRSIGRLGGAPWWRWWRGGRVERLTPPLFRVHNSVTVTKLKMPMTDTPKAGRPAKNGTPMTSAQRAREYRQRRREAAGAVTDDLDTASTQALLDGLAKRLATIEDPATTAAIAEGARWAAGKIICKLCDRHEIEIPPR